MIFFGRTSDTRLTAEDRFLSYAKFIAGQKIRNDCENDSAQTK